MARIEWRYVDDSQIGLGSWFLEHGDPELERQLTLTQVVATSDDPVWCVREHARVTVDITTRVQELLSDIESAFPESAKVAGEVVIDRDSPMAESLIRGHIALQNVVVLLVDALVECRKGRLEMALYNDKALSSEVLMALAEAINAQMWVAATLRSD